MRITVFFVVPCLTWICRSLRIGDPRREEIREPLRQVPIAAIANVLSKLSTPSFAFGGAPIAGLRHTFESRSPRRSLAVEMAEVDQNQDATQQLDGLGKEMDFDAIQDQITDMNNDQNFEGFVQKYAETEGADWSINRIKAQMDDDLMAKTDNFEGWEELMERDGKLPFQLPPAIPVLEPVKSKELKIGPQPSPLLQFLRESFRKASPKLYEYDAGKFVDQNPDNLLILWVRACLDAWGFMDDKIAWLMLPEKWRWLVKWPVAYLFAPMLPALFEATEWLRPRTEFIDNVLESFVKRNCRSVAGKDVSWSTKSAKCQIVALGTGYDTRSLRYSSLFAKGLARFWETHDQGSLKWKRRKLDVYALNDDNREMFESPTDVAHAVTRVMDLNEPRELGIAQELAMECFLDFDMPTLFICEEVLCYLKDERKADVLKQIAEACQQRPDFEFVATDNFAPFLRSESRADAERYLKEEFDFKLVDYKTMWDGDLQFIHAVPAGEREPPEFKKINLAQTEWLGRTKPWFRIS